ncbi:hypothetical protein [Dyella tabacisoli]|uniref:Uncharacterized protein n=1 Tax=Dyella tabacisoli TaxID=2282381 RepID=A0A369UK10_9GAMM|nr:hypothetical protein [Dyella tabacisoli]RDD80048.1 hypothetical protein DVJ77_19440 [Dyella tabacisoli]
MTTALNTGLMMDEYSTYRWPRGTPLFYLIGLYTLGFLIAAQPGLTNLLAGKVVVAAYFLAATLFCLYLYRFRVILDATSIWTGAFFLKRMEFAEVVRATYRQGNDSGQIILCASHGMRVRVSETIENFDACTKAINSRLPNHLLISCVGRTVPIDVRSGSDLV